MIKIVKVSAFDNALVTKDGKAQESCSSRESCDWSGSDWRHDLPEYFVDLEND